MRGSALEFVRRLQCTGERLGKKRPQKKREHKLSINTKAQKTTRASVRDERSREGASPSFKGAAAVAKDRRSSSGGALLLVGASFSAHVAPFS